MLIIHGSTGGVGNALLALARQDGHANQYGLSRFGSVYAVDREACDFNDPRAIENFYQNFFPQTAQPMYVIDAVGLCKNEVLEETSNISYYRQRAVTIDGSFFLCREFLKAAKTRPGSSLLFLSSVVPSLGIPGTAVYSMGKGAIHGLVSSSVNEFARAGATINAIEAGYLNAGMIEQVPERLLEKVVREVPVRRLGTVTELWTMAREVLSNKFVTGAIIPLTGGL